MQGNVIYPDECYAIQGAIFDVYREMGCGFLESVYQECLEYEFEDRVIPFASQPELAIMFKARKLKQKYIPDFVCFDRIVVELKAVSKVTPEHKAQVLNYLKATKMKLGLLVNFGEYPKANVIRLAL